MGIILQEKGTLTKDELIKELISLFGYSRSSKRLVQVADAAIKAARELNVVAIGEDRKYELIMHEVNKEVFSYEKIY